MKKILINIVAGLFSSVAIVTLSLPEAVSANAFSTSAVTYYDRAHVSNLRVQIIDVGQGDSALIISPTGKIALIDAGPYRSGRAVAQILQQQKITRIDYLVATHSHADHIGGMDLLIKQFDIGTFVDSGLPTTSAAYERLIKAIQIKSISQIQARAGDSYDLGGGVKLEVLSPPGNGRWIKSTFEANGQPDVNVNSIVIRLSYKTFDMLFMGDAKEETEKDLLTRKVNVKAQIIKIGFHGSRGASTKEFLEATRARTAIISCGSDNPFGHPRQETLDRIRKGRMELFRTDLQGDIVLTTNGDAYEVMPQRTVNQAALFIGYKKAPGLEPGP